MSQSQNEHPTYLEVCICAAIRLPDGQVVRGHRHADCIRTARELIEHRYEQGFSATRWAPALAADQGFVTSRERYVGRAEAYLLQIAAGRRSVAPDGYRGTRLFSEDLY